MAIGTRRHKLLTGDNVGSLVRWTVADSTARLALLLTVDDNGALARQTDDNSYWILTAFAAPTWTQLGNVTNNTSSASDPTVNDDELDGYEIGDGWVNTTTKGVFILTDATAGAAVWTGLAGAVSSVFGRSGAIVAVEGDYDDSKITLSGIIGSPTNNLASELHDVTGSVATVNGGGNITDDADGTITVGAGTGFIRATDSDTAALLSFDFGAEGGAGVALADNDMNYVYVEYNAGTPQTIATTTKRTDYNTNLLLATVYRDGTTLHVTDHSNPSGNVSNRLVRRLTDVDGLAHASGAATSESGTRTLAITAGSWWVGLEPVTTAAIDTNVADTFFRYYRDGGGGWTTDAAETVVNNTQYDDGSGTLASLTGSRKGVHWVFKAIDGDTYVVFGRGNYTTGQAEEATIPEDLPPHFAENHAVLAAKITLQRNGTNFLSVESAFVKHFTSGAPTSHADLADLGADDHTQYAQTLSGAGVPGVSTGNGFRLGTTYADTTNDVGYTLVDATTDANVWSGDGGGGTVDFVSNVATARILGRITGGSGDSEELTKAQTLTFLNVEDGATADQTGAEIKAAYEVEANAFTDSQFTKLAGIETAADVTDTANVTAAGALMDSEVDADLKTFALPASTTISAFGRTLVDDADAAAARTTLGAGVGDLLAAGTVAQDAALFTERADHVNTPGAGVGETWLDNSALQNFMFTDDAGDDFSLNHPLQCHRMGGSVVTTSTHWRTHPQTTGYMAETWNFSAGVNSADPTFARFNSGLYFETPATIEKIVVVGAEASPGTATIEVECWQVPLTDGDTSSGSKTQIAGLSHTFTTTNKMYVKEMTITDAQVVAGSQVQIFIKSDEARTQKMHFTVYFREDAAVA